MNDVGLDHFVKARSTKECKANPASAEGVEALSVCRGYVVLVNCSVLIFTDNNNNRCEEPTMVILFSMSRVLSPILHH